MKDKFDVTNLPNHHTEEVLEISSTGYGLESVRKDKGKQTTKNQSKGTKE